MQPVSDAPGCVPEVQVIERIIPLPADLLLDHAVPTVPSSGEVGALLDWCEDTAIAARMCGHQVRAIRELQGGNP